MSTLAATSSLNRPPFPHCVLLTHCLQFDILWPLLTVIETLLFYCRIKGVPPGQMRDLATDTAFAVDLGHVPNRLVGKLSGGMKRRVSLAISLIGNPRVIFLDEPTTGLDPETKRAMWSLIDMAKADRCIILTTHSMEEADALCGRIGIMAYGRLRCLGSSLHLKNKFGAGYKLDVDTESGSDSLTKAMEFVTSSIPSSTKLGVDAGTVTFHMPIDKVKLSKLFTIMEQRPASAGIKDWALRQTSMEEVFLHIALAAEEERANSALTTIKVASLPPSPPASDSRVAPGPPHSDNETTTAVQVLQDV